MIEAKNTVVCNALKSPEAASSNTTYPSRPTIIVPANNFHVEKNINRCAKYFRACIAKSSGKIESSCKIIIPLPSEMKNNKIAIVPEINGTYKGQVLLFIMSLLRNVENYFTRLSIWQISNL
jgi:hypothetical protein